MDIIEDCNHALVTYQIAKHYWIACANLVIGAIQINDLVDWSKLFLSPNYPALLLIC